MFPQRGKTRHASVRRRAMADRDRPRRKRRSGPRRAPNRFLLADSLADCIPHKGHELLGRLPDVQIDDDARTGVDLDQCRIRAATVLQSPDESGRAFGEIVQRASDADLCEVKSIRLEQARSPLGAIVLPSRRHWLRQGFADSVNRALTDRVHLRGLSILALRQCRVPPMLSALQRAAAAFCAFATVFAVHQVDAAPAEEGVRRATPSGLPVPRFVSLRYSETNCRSGPSFEHPVAFKFLRAGAPVMVIAETHDHWRKIRDAEGSQCWAHQTTLAARDHVLVLAETPLRARPSLDAPVKARLAPGLLAEFDGAERAFARVKAAGVSGWVDADALWGVDVAARH